MNNTLFKLFDFAIEIINNLIYILISLALVGFMWGIVKIIFNNADPKARQEGRSYMIYGILTLFVMTSVWSIVYLFKDFLTTSTDSGSTQNIQIVTGSSSVASPKEYESFKGFEEINRY